MSCVNFRWKCRKCKRGCLSFASMAILVNGSPTGKLQLKKGFRQGDPLSSFLFLVVVEGLSCLMHREMETKIFEGGRFLVSHFSLLTIRSRDAKDQDHRN